MSERISTRTAVSILIAILLLGGALRFYNLTQRGIFDYDEAWYLLEAKTLYNTGRFALARAGLTEDADAEKGLKAYIKGRGTVPLTSIKPGHTILLFVGLLLFGPHDYAGFLISAAAGLFTVFLVYRLGREMYGRDVGLLAALYLAASPFHILYSRAAYAQANGIFLVTFAAYLWYRAHSRSRSSPWSLVVPGLMVGWAFTCHFNLAWVPVAFMALEAVVVFRQGDRFPSRWIRGTRLAALGAAMAAPPLAFELIGRAAKWIGVFPADYPTYLGQFAHRESLARGLRFSMEQIPFWTSRLFQIEGILAALLIAAGSAVVLLRIRRLHLNDLLVLGLFLAAVAPSSLVWIEGHYYILRNFALASPALALMAGVGGAWVCRRVESGLGHRAFVACAAVLGLLVAANGGLHAGDLLPIRSGYSQATRDLMQHMSAHGGRLATRPPSAWPIWYFYISEAYDEAPPELRKRIRFYPPKGEAGDYELLDIKRYYRGLVNEEGENLVHYSRIRRHAKPIVRVANAASALPKKYFEAGGKRADATLRELATRYPESAWIEIYDLRGLNPKVLSMSSDVHTAEDRHE